MKYLKDISGITLFLPEKHSDHRGNFYELFRKSNLINDINFDVKQINNSFSKKNVLRGMHYQLEPKLQAKIVYCIKGEIYDVGIDLRQNSPTYLKWCKAFLSEDNKAGLYIPKGFAHGFCVLSDCAEVVYLCDEEYNQKYDRSVRWDGLGIEWPIEKPILSEKDKNSPLLKDCENNFYA